MGKKMGYMGMLIAGILLVVGLGATVSFSQVCTLNDLKAVNPSAVCFIEENPYFFVKDGVVYETLTAGKDQPLPLPRIVTNRPLKVGCLELGPIMQVKRHYHQSMIEAAHRGWEITVLEASNPPDERRALETVINKNVDVIIITYWTMPALRDLIIKAREKGIGVYVIDTELQPGVILDPTAHQGVGAAKMAYYALEKMGLRGQVAVITMARELAERERRDVILALMGSYGIEVVGREDLTTMDSHLEDAFKFAQDTIIKYGDEDLKWIFGIWDGIGLSASRAIEQAGYQGKIFTNGMDGGDQIFDLIRKGESLVACAVQPYEWYDHAAWVAIDQLQVQGIVPLSPKSMINESRTVFSEQALVTVENLPPDGTSIHELFNYYNEDPNDPDAWYNWQDAGGPYALGTMAEMICYPEQIK